MRSPRPPFRRPRTGLALLDTLVALGLAVLVLLAFLQLLITAYATSTTLTDSTIAYNAARQIIENARQYKGAPFATGDYNASAFGAVPQLSQLRNGTAAVNIASQTTGVKKLSIRITWTVGIRGGSTRTYDAIALVSSNGIAP